MGKRKKSTRTTFSSLEYQIDFFSLYFKLIVFCCCCCCCYIRTFQNKKKIKTKQKIFFNYFLFHLPFCFFVPVFSTSHGPTTFNPARFIAYFLSELISNFSFHFFEGYGHRCLVYCVCVCVCFCVYFERKKACVIVILTLITNH